VILLGALAAGALVTSLGLAVIGPLGVRAHGRHPDAADLCLVLSGWTTGRWEFLRLACVVVVALVVIPLGAWPIVGAAPLVPSLVLRARAMSVRERAAGRSLEVLQATHAALRSGVPLAAALRLALERTDPVVRDPFERALRAFELNGQFVPALRDSARGSHDRRVRLALDALALAAAEQLPAQRAAALVAGVADRLAFERRLVDEVRASTSGIRGQILLLALLVPALAAYLVATMPGLAATLATPLGTHVLVPTAIVFEIVGIVASRTIVRGLAT
jgi:Flp pilus assembly protein TadB